VLAANQDASSNERKKSREQIKCLQIGIEFLQKCFHIAKLICCVFPQSVKTLVKNLSIRGVTF
jgi:hypothetical protein